MIIKEIQAAETYALRIEVLRNGISKNYKFEGDNDKSSFHIGAYYKNKPIGICTFIKRTYPSIHNKHAYQLRGMAVHPEHQKKGVGKKMIRYSIELLLSKDCPILWCNAREVAVGFYKRIGFQCIDKPFNIPGIGLHYVMYKKL